MAQTFGQKLRAEREIQGWKQKDLARLCGVSVRTVQTWEADKRFPKWEEIEALLRVTGRPCTWLFPKSRRSRA